MSTFRQAREEAGLSLDEAASAATSHRMTISKVERGERGVGLDLATRLADAYQVSLDRLAGRDTLAPVVWELDRLRAEAEAAGDTWRASRIEAGWRPLEALLAELDE